VSKVAVVMYDGVSLMVMKFGGRVGEADTWHET